MSRFYKSLCASLCAFSLTSAYADVSSGLDELMPDAMAELTVPSTPNQELSAVPSDAAATSEVKIAAKPKAKAIDLPFTAFTGKVKGRKVRLRLQPDVESQIISELDKSELVSIVGEKGDFWAVRPNHGIKAYVFRSFVLDNIIEGNRVNVRLEPSLDAPVISHFNSGDRITNSVISAQNSKWLEIDAPEQTTFYVSKDYIEYAGTPDVKKQYDKRRHTVEQLIETNTLMSQGELRKPFDEIDFERVCEGYHSIVSDFADFPDHIEHAKEALATFQEEYLQQRITHLENQTAQEAMAAEQHANEVQERSEIFGQLTDRMRMWEPIEEAIYSSWANMTEKNGIDDFYADQQLTSTDISGILEAYNSPVKAKPGDFIVRENGVPIAYVYSTHVNLQGLLGKKVNLVASPRPNNNFAFPAYYVLDVQ